MRRPRSDKARAVRPARELDDAPVAPVEVELTAQPKGTPFRCVDAFGAFEAGRQVLKVTPDE